MWRKQHRSPEKALDSALRVLAETLQIVQLRVFSWWAMGGEPTVATEPEPKGASGARRARRGREREREGRIPPQQLKIFEAISCISAVVSLSVTERGRGRVVRAGTVGTSCITQTRKAPYTPLP